MLEFNFTSILNLIGFAILAYFLWILLYKPFFEIMEKRRNIIESNLNEAEKARKDANQKLEEAKKKIIEAQEKAAEIIKNAENMAKRIVDEAKQQAIEEKNKIIANAEMEAKEIKDRAYAEVQNKIVALSITIASAILKKEIDAKTHEQIIKNVISKLKEGE